MSVRPFRQNNEVSLLHETEIVWLESPEPHEYVREVFWPANTPAGKLAHEAGRTIGYAVLCEDAPQARHDDWSIAGYWLRRVFIIKEQDRSNQPEGPYKHDKPAEGVDPLTVLPGKLGEHNARAWAWGKE